MNKCRIEDQKLFSSNADVNMIMLNYTIYVNYYMSKKILRANGRDIINFFFLKRNVHFFGII